MPDYFDRPYQGAADLPALIEFAQQSKRAAAPSYYHPGDFVWQLYPFAATEDVRLWLDHGRVVACAIFEPPLTFQFAMHPAVESRPRLTAEVLRWAEKRRTAVLDKDAIPLAYQQLGTTTLTTWALDSDRERSDVLVQNGYRRGNPGGVRFARSLVSTPPEVQLPAGAHFRVMTDGDAEARAELHRDAWSVWGESAHTVEKYRELRGAPLYDPALDVVLEFEDRLVSYCVCWIDEVNRIGYFEPVGTRPSATGRGFGRAVIREGMRRLRIKGMELATVGTASINEPAQALYASAGFAVVDGEHFYTKSDADM